VIVSHSMGGLQTLHFLTQQTQAWKDEHIREWVAISAPYGGANLELRDFVSGDNQGLPVKSLTIRVTQRTSQTNVWLLPVPRWHDNTPIVTTPSRNYSAQDYTSFFRDIGYEDGLKVYKQVEQLPNRDMPPPGVQVRCLYSTGVDTPMSFDYPEGLDSPKVVVRHGDGDGTVVAGSLKLCETWASQGLDKPVTSKAFHGLSHADMLKSPEVIAEVLGAASPSRSSFAGTTVMV